jgi:hypothetical protein
LFKQAQSDTRLNNTNAAKQRCHREQNALHERPPKMRFFPLLDEKLCVSVLAMFPTGRSLVLAIGRHSVNDECDLSRKSRKNESFFCGLICPTGDGEGDSEGRDILIAFGQRESRSAPTGGSFFVRDRRFSFGPGA